MINIISNQEYNEIEKYLMTISPAIESMKIYQTVKRSR